MGGLGINKMPDSSPILKFFSNIKENMIVVPLYSLAQVAGCLKQNGHQIIVLNGDRIPKNDAPDAFIIPSSMVSSNDECKLGTRLKLQYPNSKIIFFGPFASSFSDKYLNHGDLVVQGEPENFFLSLKYNDPIPIGTVKSATLEDLDAIPFPAWEYFNIKQYRYEPVLSKRPMVTMLASRSCPYSCKYCPYPVVYGPYRKRSIPSMVDEIDRLVNSFGVRSILFRDPLFFVKENNIEEFIKAVQIRKLKFEWVCETRVEFFEKDILRGLSSIGLKGINCGIESLVPEVLSSERRKELPVEKYKIFAKMCRDLGIWVTGFYVFGFLKETPNTLLETIEFAKEINFPVVQFTVNTPIPLADEFTEFESILTEANWDKFSFYNLTFDHPHFSPNQMRRFQKKALWDYYFRFNYWKQNRSYFKNKFLPHKF